VLLKLLQARLRTLLLCAVLETGVLGGVQMPPEKIRDLLHAMNQPTIVHVLREDDDRGDSARDDDVGLR
jgi:hypothetical protein